MVTMSIALSEYEHVAPKCLKRPLDSCVSKFELPPAVKIKTIDSQHECFLSARVGTSPARDVEPLDIEASTKEGNVPQQTRYGHRLIPQLIDERAKSDPHDPCWSVRRSSNLSDGFRDISYGQVARAINRVSWWIEQNVGKSTTFETLAYMGPPDLRYAVLTVAAQKTGHVVSHTSIGYLQASRLYSLGLFLFTLEHHGSALTSS